MHVVRRGTKVAARAFEDNLGQGVQEGRGCWKWGGSHPLLM
jgi:hypothetical protein